MSFKRAIHLDVPVEADFEMFRNPADGQQFAGKRMVPKNVTLMRDGVGTTTYEWIAKVASIPITGYNVCAELVPNRRVTDRCSRAFEGTSTYTFEPHGSGTKLTHENEPVSFWLFPPLRRLLGWATARPHEPVMAELQAWMAPDWAFVGRGS